MQSGTHSTVEYLAIRLLYRWVPKWYAAFCDPHTGGFYERLGRGFKPVQTGARRLLTQCRQLAIYSDAVTQPGLPGFSPDLRRHFDHIAGHYRDPATGQWFFSLDDSGAVADRTCDLYAISFVIFSFSYYFRATGDDRARDLALETARLIDSRFRMPGLPGFAEALDADGRAIPRLRRQNPHMHLLEACLFAHDTWGDALFLTMATEMVDLFRLYFFDSGPCALHEFFTDTLAPDAEQGNRVEPGHYFEWVWLLKRHGAATGEPGCHDDLCLRLLDWANAYGWDRDYGGIYDVLAPDGRVLVDTKRLWPFTEGLKANALMLDTVPVKEPVKARIADMAHVFRARYMQERGFWVEWLSRDLVPQSDYMPGTTPYHVYFGIMETRRYLHTRGSSVSWLAPGVRIFYRLRRAAAMKVRAVRGAIGS